MHQNKLQILKKERKRELTFSYLKHIKNDAKEKYLCEYNYKLTSTEQYGKLARMNQKIKCHFFLFLTEFNIS